MYQREQTAAVRLPPARSPADGTVDILVLSGGGFWGAYGAGFLTGWSSRPPSLGLSRPEFDLVTGISTGAIMAPFALLGQQQDEKLRKAYDGIAGADLLPRQSLLRLLQTNAFADTRRLKEALDEALDDDVLDGLAIAGQSGRFVLIGATNFDDGRLTIFDLTSIASSEKKTVARDLMRDRIVASSAFPLLLPPQFVDGCMYMDGSVRQGLFLLEQAELADFLRSLESLPVKVRIFTILNGPATSDRRLVENNLLALMSRGAELAIDQGQLAVLRSIFDFTQKKGFQFYWTSADLGGSAELRKICGPPPNPLRDLNPAFTHCLFSLGEERARDLAKPWRQDRP